jgi:Phosphomannomutase
MLGADIIALNTSPNGTNINNECGALHTTHLQQEVVKQHADIGFAFDGDGDRVIAVNRNGGAKNGDDIIALLSQHPLYMQQKTIVGTIMSNHGLELFLHAQGKHLVRTAVGDKYVAAYLNDHQNLLGGEQSGHIIMYDYLQTGDGMMTALRIIETIIMTNNWDMKTFERLPQILINIPVVHKRDLKDPDIASIITHYEQQLDSGRVIVRYSGTENLLRVMVEDTTQKAAQTIGTNLGKALQQKLQ